MLLTDEMRRATGALLRVQTVQVTAGMIDRFRRALAVDPAEYQGSGSDQEASPGFFLCLSYLSKPPVQAFTDLVPFQLPGTQRFDAGMECEVYRPVRVGDTVVSRITLAGVTERARESKGPMLLVQFQMDFTDQQGAKLAKIVRTSMAF